MQQYRVCPEPCLFMVLGPAELFGQFAHPNLLLKVAGGHLFVNGITTANKWHPNAVQEIFTIIIQPLSHCLPACEQASGHPGWGHCIDQIWSMESASSQPLGLYLAAERGAVNWDEESVGSGWPKCVSMFFLGMELHCCTMWLTKNL